jgi:SAM-dependent MidA family methyltransferase
VPRLPSPAGLPEPDAAARAHSVRVAASVREAIELAGGWLSFEAYMGLVLYAPGLGYYVAGTRKFGAGGDFVTGPELTPLYGAALAQAIAPMLEAPGSEVLELGAGSGALAASLLDELARLRASPSRYRIVEVSPELRGRQRQHLERSVPDLLDRVSWEIAPPSNLAGAVVMNEVLDAIPVSLIARRGGRWFERGVGVDGARFAFHDRALDESAPGDRRLLALAAARFPAGVDYTSELNPAAEALVGSLGRRLSRGAIVVVDYGFERDAYYHPQRSEGTLMAHYRHRAHADPFLWPGLTDITAHVDFTAIADAGARAGLVTASYASQARFLVEHGILERLAGVGPPGSLDYMRAAAAVQTLLSPAEMGELFKVMVLLSTREAR